MLESFTLSRSHLAALEKLCLARLAEMPIGDAYGKIVADALLEGAAHFGIDENSLVKRAECALRLIKKINTLQHRKVGNLRSLPQTKGALWEALLYAWRKTQDGIKEETFARGLLETTCFDHEEYKALGNILREVRGQCNFPFRKVARLLSLAQTGSNEMAIHFMSKEFAVQLSPAALARFGKQNV
ncbi:MAG TPA: hypothetical protein VMR46_02355 [Candidatus Paceibacterota bacterium]|nr:hypothetical protein [Candidatus Paceibacterota bacterium]